MKAVAAFMAVWVRALVVGEKGWLSCAAVETFIEAGLVTEADVGEAHEAVWAVVFGSAECAWRNGREGRAAVQTIFDFRDQAGPATLIFD